MWLPVPEKRYTSKVGKGKVHSPTRVRKYGERKERTDAVSFVFISN